VIVREIIMKFARGIVIAVKVIVVIMTVTASIVLL
jgi:hypothetical protein